MTIIRDPAGVGMTSEEWLDLYARTRAYAPPEVAKKLEEYAKNVRLRHQAEWRARLDWSNRRISAPDVIDRAISAHDEPSLGIREAIQAIWRLAIAIVLTLCARIRSGRMSNPEPRR